MKNGDFDEARPLFENLVRLNPKELSAHVALAGIYGRLGEPGLARKETEIVNKLESEKASAAAAHENPSGSEKPQ
jgi:Tfp pilus assembly protein PilF